ncbi:MAG: DUF222 domain-containing protein [Sporichthyaceae bacterium]
MAERLPTTLDTLCEGSISLASAKALLSETSHLTQEHARAVEAAVLPKAGRLTPGQVRAETRKAIAKLDPDLCRERHEAARKARHVGLSPASDGMAWLSAYLTARDAEAVYGVINAHAATDTGPSDERCIDERRADAIVDLILDPDGQRPHVSTQIRVVVPAGTLLGLGDEPGHLPGYGPIPAALAREIAADATWRRILTDPVSGEILDLGTIRYRPSPALIERIKARDGTCRFPTCTRRGRYVDADHVISHRPDGTGGATSELNLICLCRRHHRVKHLPGWRVELDANGTVTWTTPAGHVHRSRPAGLPAPAD